MSGCRLKIKRVLFFVLYSFLLLLFSCSTKNVSMPSIEEISMDEMMKKLKKINNIEAVLAIDYESLNSSMSGDASLNLSKDSLDLRVYYLGFLVGEISEKNGIITSNPKLSRNKGILLVDGLRNSLFWWDIEDYTIQEEGDTYILENTFKRIYVDKKTLLPVKQIVEFGDGERLELFYEKPKAIDESEGDIFINLWYNSKITFKFKNYTAIVRIKNIKFN